MDVHNKQSDSQSLETCQISRTMSSESVKIEMQGPLREDLIKTAVGFLTNPNVQRAPTTQKEAFLKKKGLSEEEIKVAMVRSASVSNLNVEVPVMSNHLIGGQNLQYVQPSWFQRLRDILNTIALLVGSVYAVHYLYNRFIAPFLFGKSRKPKPIQDTLNDMSQELSKSFHDIKVDIAKMQDDLQKVVVVQNEQQVSVKQIHDLKSEVTTVKGILLSRHQFPAVGLSASSIPSWQMTARMEKEKDGECDDVEHTSGSSETEVVNNPNSNGGSQGSDSSLEMIKEVEG